MDVLIKPEEVVAIVFALQRNKAVVVFAVGGLHPFMALIAQVVHVHTIHPKGPKNRIHFTGPGDVRFVGGRIAPY